MVSPDNFHEKSYLYIPISMCARKLYYRHKSRERSHPYLISFYTKTMKYRVSQEIQISIPTINAAFDRLQELGIVREITDRQRDKLYSYENYINLLSEGTEPIQ